MEMKIVGKIEFDRRVLPVWYDVNEPLFKAVDVARLLDYSCGKTYDMMKLVEEDEKTPLLIPGQSGQTWFISELGLYNLLSQSRKPIARKWRRVIHTQLIEIRKKRSMDIMQQFSEWDMMVEGLYFDEDTGILMQSVNLPGGDADVVPYTPGYTAYFNVETNRIERRRNEEHL